MSILQTSSRHQTYSAFKQTIKKYVLQMVVKTSDSCKTSPRRTCAIRFTTCWFCKSCHSWLRDEWHVKQTRLCDLLIISLAFSCQLLTHQNLQNDAVPCSIRVWAAKRRSEVNHISRSYSMYLLCNVWHERNMASVPNICPGGLL